MTTTEVATPERKPKTLVQLIGQMTPEMAKVLPNQMSPERMARIATTCLKQNDKLALCSAESFLGALLTASQLGLEPGPTGEAYLVPYRNSKTGQYICQFIPGYRGLIKLARNSGQLVDIWAEIVYSNDVFRHTLGLHRDLIHEPAIGDRGKPTHVYAAALLRGGGTPFQVLTMAEVESLRSRSRGANNGPWVSDYLAMAKKTAVRQLAKWLPQSAELRAAVTLDGSVRTDISALTEVTPDYIDGDADEQQAIAAPAEASEPADEYGDLLDAAAEGEA